MRRILCLAVVLSALSGPALAGMSEGVAAVTVGDYPKAIAEFQPLAAGGDPAAQYQLAKIYLEGHGPADGLPQGLDLMNKAANGGFPEAQAQLGLMYAMGLGLPVDNVQAYDWLSKAVAALPDGTRRAVAEANRDAVLKRMNASQQAAVTAKAPAPAKPAQEAASKPAATTAAPAATAATTKPAATAATTKTVTETAATPAKPAATATTTKTVTEAAATTAKPAAADTTTKTATNTTATNTTAATAKPAATEAPAKSAEKSVEKPADKPTQVASAEPAGAEPAKADPTAKPTGVRVQLASLPSEAAAWDAWKQISGKYSAQLTGLTAMVESADLGTKGTFYRVQTGPFATVAAAQERCTAMKAAGLDCLVVGKP